MPILITMGNIIGIMDMTMAKVSRYKAQNNHDRHQDEHHDKGR
jgi:hypothetical protein